MEVSGINEVEKFWTRVVRLLQRRKDERQIDGGGKKSLKMVWGAGVGGGGRAWLSGNTNFPRIYLKQGVGKEKHTY
jgi:hypothetical protein